MSKTNSVKNCLTCIYEPEWFEEKDLFNSCEHCNTQTLGVCKKVADIFTIWGQPANWPLSVKFVQVQKRKMYPGEVFTDHRPPLLVVNCPAYKSKNETELEKKKDARTD